MSIALRGVIVVWIIGALFTASARADDKDQIKASGKAFAEALAKGDVATAKQHAITDEKTEKFLDTIGAMYQAREKLVAAAVAKFGDQGSAILPGKGFGAAPNIAAKMDSAQIDVAGDTATVTSKDAPDKSIKFKKQDGQWKLDMPSLPDLDKLDEGVSKLAALSTAMTDTASDITAGKYQTVQEARTGLFQKIVAAFQPSGAGR